MNRNLNQVIRSLERSMAIRAESTDAAVLAFGPELDGDGLGFHQADDTARRRATEEGEARAAMELVFRTFQPEYDKCRGAILSLMPFADLQERSSRLDTPDDVVNAGRKMATLLGSIGGVDEAHPIDGVGDAAPTGKPWALGLIRQFHPFLEAAAKASENVRVAAERSKEAVEERARKRQVLEQDLLSFRRIVKDVYGAKSKQYQQLRGRAEQDSQGDQPPVPTPVPTPT